MVCLKYIKSFANIGSNEWIRSWQLFTLGKWLEINIIFLMIDFFLKLFSFISVTDITCH